MLLKCFYAKAVLLCIILVLCALYLYILVTLLSGDIELNPGPSSSDYSLPSSNSNSNSLPFIFENNSSNSVTFVHLNVQSLLPKLEILETELYNHSILSFTETWLKDSDVNPDIYLDNFQPPFWKCRNGQLGGGVAVYVKNDIHVNKNKTELDIKLELDKSKYYNLNETNGAWKK